MPNRDGTGPRWQHLQQEAQQDRGQGSDSPEVIKGGIGCQRQQKKGQGLRSPGTSQGRGWRRNLKALSPRPGRGVDRGECR